ncbi:MAG: triacylglycerol lipase [Lachnospiraceae bacterium]|nr:triacylglycerol lipase [Lachnospiraceae bacterium]
MSTNVRKVIAVIITFIIMNISLICELMGSSTLTMVLLILAGNAVILWIVLFTPINKNYKELLKYRQLARGVSLLEIFMLSTALEIVYLVIVIMNYWDTNKKIIWLNIFVAFLVELVLFWVGIIRVYLTSSGIGIKWRVIGIILGYWPVLNLIALTKIMNISYNELKLETDKIRINKERKDEMICKTKYPILLVHGVFFRDFDFVNYWGRVPGELIQNGADIYYGNQESAGSVADNGKFLAKRIKEIIEETGSEKVNIIAHSKGGLDSRYAITCEGMAPYVASLTTINTPHRGCIFADYLLDNIPKKIRDDVANQYNTTLIKLGDKNPNFIEAVTDLRATVCNERNEELKDAEGVHYYSVCSKMNKASSGRFPLNLCYPLVKNFDGENDGLVAVESAKWGEDFTFITTDKGRGISHADMIDLNRENIKGFDVREFYVQYVHKLKKLGF